VSPIPIELAIKEACPILSQVIVVGDERKYLTCLLTIKCKSDRSRPTEELAADVASFL